MAHSESPQSGEPPLGPVFRRVVPCITTSTIEDEDHIEQIGGRSSHHVIDLTQQSVDDFTETDTLNQTEPVELKPRLIIAVDFGTTYSTVSYAKVDVGVDSTKLPINKICCIDNYECADGFSDARANARAENVPTKLLYLGLEASDLQHSDMESDEDYDSLGDTDVQSIPSPHYNCRRRKRGGKPFIHSPRRKARTTWTRAAGTTVYWGFSVQDAQRNAYVLARDSKKEAVELIKLTLGDDPDEDKELIKKRAQLAAQIKELCSKNFIQDRNQLVCDYLARLLQHAKVFLNREGLLEGAQLEYVLCVPVSWSVSACRTMHDAMSKAVQACKLDVLAQGFIPDLFIVSEPEAAAQYVIASLGNEGRLRQGEVFIILDAGGGTVDIATYKVTSNETGPLRLQGEAIPPDGAMCGSSLITERFYHTIRAKLSEVDPHGDKDDLDSLATAFTNDWDMRYKPGIDVAKKNMMKKRPGGRQYHKGQVIHWTEEDIHFIFEGSLKGTIGLLKTQLQLAKQKNLFVSKLIVVGGFGESPSLRTRIQQVLSTYFNCNGESIEPIWPRHLPTSAVARGAVLRALDKRNGPSRISRSSFGFLRHERYGEFPEHEEAEAKPQKDSVDHEQFVRDTIYWVIQPGDELPTTGETEPILSCHAFEPWDVRLICVEKLYVSSHKHRSHFQCQHKENKDATLLSYIEIDVSDLKNEFPLEYKADAGPRTKLRNRSVRMVTFDLVIRVEGKQLKYEARWPPGTTTPDEVRIRKSGLVSLAPSFAPGTE